MIYCLGELQSQGTHFQLRSYGLCYTEHNLQKSLRAADATLGPERSATPSPLCFSALPAIISFDFLRPDEAEIMFFPVHRKPGGLGPSYTKECDRNLTFALTLPAHTVRPSSPCQLLCIISTTPCSPHTPQKSNTSYLIGSLSRLV